MEVVQEGREGGVNGEHEFIFVLGEILGVRVPGEAAAGTADVNKAGTGLDQTRGPFGYEPRLSAYLDCNPKTGRITRFEFVALGDTYGYPNTDDPPGSRPGAPDASRWESPSR